MAAGVAIGGLGHNVAPRTDPNDRRHMRGLEGGISALQLPPEGPPARISRAGEVLGRHPERKDVHMKAWLTTVQRRRNQAPNLVDHGIRHGKAADRAHARTGSIERIGKAKVEGAMPAACRIERPHRHRVEAFRRLPVAFPQLGAKLPRPTANGIGRKALETIAALHPQLQFEFALEDAHEHRSAERQALSSQAAGEVGKVWCPRERLPRRDVRQSTRTFQLDGDGLEGIAPPIDQWMAQERRSRDEHRDSRHGDAPDAIALDPPAARALLVAHRTGARLISGRLSALPYPPEPVEPVDNSPERVASSAFARLRI